jgi:PEP-CTERM motif
MNTRTLTVHALLALAAIGAASHAHAQVLNGNFGSGLTNWNPLGDVIVTVDVPPRTVTLSTAATEETGNWSGISAADVGILEVAAGVVGNGFNLNEQQSWEGSLIKQNFVVTAGQTLSFQWSFRTNETLFLDHAFVAFNGQVTTLATSASPGLSSQSFSRTFTQSGPVLLAIGVVDTGDVDGVSYLSIKNVQITPVPEPSTWLLMAAGAGLLAWRSRRA